MNRNSVVICTRNAGYEASLERRKLYATLPDADALAHDQLRVIDESGDDYLYPRTCFEPIELPQDLIQAVFEAA